MASASDFWLLSSMSKTLYPDIMRISPCGSHAVLKLCMPSFMSKTLYLDIMKREPVWIALGTQTLIAFFYEQGISTQISCKVSSVSKTMILARSLSRWVWLIWKKPGKTADWQRRVCGRPTMCPWGCAVRISGGGQHQLFLMRSIKV
jgi:hypothetical protein